MMRASHQDALSQLNFGTLEGWGWFWFAQILIISRPGNDQVANNIRQRAPYIKSSLLAVDRMSLQSAIESFC
jgi:hypothetical protein